MWFYQIIRKCFYEKHHAYKYYYMYQEELIIMSHPKLNFESLFGWLI